MKDDVSPSIYQGPKKLFWVEHISGVYNAINKSSILVLTVRAHATTATTMSSCFLAYGAYFVPVVSYLVLTADVFGLWVPTSVFDLIFLWSRGSEVRMLSRHSTINHGNNVCFFYRAGQRY